jgi:hypothetical protein
MKKSSILLFLTGLGCGFLLLLSYIIISGMLPATSVKGRVPLETSANSEIISGPFSTANYVKSISKYTSPAEIEQQYRLFSDTSGNDSGLQQKFYSLTTDSLYTVWQKYFSNQDSMVFVLHFAERINSHCPENPNTKFMYSAIANFWFDKLAKGADSLIAKNTYAKLSYSTRYIIDRCAQRQYLVNMKISKFEKGLIRLSESRFSYLLNRILLEIEAKVLAISTGIILIMVVLGIFTVASWFFLARTLIAKIRNKQ